MAFLKSEWKFLRANLTEVNMDLIQEESLSMEPLDKILASIPHAGDCELVPILQKIRRDCALRRS